MPKKGLKFVLVAELAKLYFIHIICSTEIVKKCPGFDDWPEYPFVQIRSSSPCDMQRQF